MTALTPTLSQVIYKLQSLPSLRASYLAGGTNLTIRFNHRHSIDVDLFFNNIIGRQGFKSIEEEIIQQFGQSTKILYPCNEDDQFVFMRAYIHLKGETIKVEVLQNMKTLYDIEVSNDFRLASIKDIGLFKLISCSRRGNKKDIYDLDYITDEIDLSILMHDLDLKLDRYQDEEHKTIFDLDTQANPINNPKLLLKFDDEDLQPDMPGHSSDRLLIIQDQKSWPEARFSWRMKVRKWFRDNGIEFPTSTGIEIN